MSGICHGMTADDPSRWSSSDYNDDYCSYRSWRGCGSFFGKGGSDSKNVGNVAVATPNGGVGRGSGQGEGYGASEGNNVHGESGVGYGHGSGFGIEQFFLLLWCIANGLFRKVSLKDLQRGMLCCACLVFFFFFMTSFILMLLLSSYLFIFLFSS